MAYVTSRQHSVGVVRSRLNPMAPLLSERCPSLPGRSQHSRLGHLVMCLIFLLGPVALLCILGTPGFLWSSLSLSYIPFPLLAQSWHGVSSSLISERLIVSPLDCLAVTAHELAGHSRTYPHYAGIKRGSSKLYTGQSSGYRVGVINYLWCHYFLLPLTFHQAGAVTIYNKIFSRVFCS